MKILVSGFDPFGGEKINPAIEAVKLLSDEIKGNEVIKIEIPTVIGKSVDKLKEKIAEVKPDVVISVGQAGGREDITVERVAINVDDCRIKDNEGNQPIDEKIAEDGPDAYLLTLPIKAIVENIKSANIPASVSNTAGTFICNHVAYGMAHLRATEYPNMRTGFIHIPFLPEQVLNKAHTASMSLDTIVKALEKAIEAVIDNDEDIKVTGGKTH
ncbi:pyroglutamyl-peptidase I [Finegoldia magna]|uniref:pyroglutamyl-peptidase I n=1 Tax=Finegoldia magna TaxID=1260 RepID=UPI000B91705A|nr:pyroglutamyl-peptidase I [Finegoldia magna]MDU4571334.1 pyroglutamyl-peptidase I [Finegoldia magna]MDU5070577.1 pyroglutamyl-peptidase I [Finegoldia magna]MDU5998217.1 pyroglutamyl-peptidase I [Finegoldia magna]OXZ35892.1 pyroglutamyl-peptidase I [Finegoldia magna]